MPLNPTTSRLPRCSGSGRERESGNDQTHWIHEEVTKAATERNRLAHERLSGAPLARAGPPPQLTSTVWPWIVIDPVPEPNTQRCAVMVGIPRQAPASTPEAGQARGGANLHVGHINPQVALSRNAER